MPAPDVTSAIRNGKREPAGRGLWLYRLNLEYQREWVGKWHAPASGAGS
jgi:hypothetical protein